VRCDGRRRFPEALLVYEEKFSVDGDVLVVVLKGPFPKKQIFGSAENVFTQLGNACSQHGLCKVLLDARELEVRMETMDLFRSGSDLAGIAEPGFRAALVARPELIDRFFEDVAANRGACVRVFTDAEEARAWLAGP
jgi:hypothetical protein